MLKCQCRLFHIPAGDESDWEAWARSPFSTDPGGRATSDRVNTNLSAPSGLGTSELLLPRPVVADGAVGLTDEGKAKHIGVSNYYEDDVADLLSYARVKPACNQIELHPRLPRDARVVTARWLRETLETAAVG